ncbi:hypothetical protein ASE21_11675 [Flavobacterium sp. Root901]|uniref:DUF72 domain-containing protein n=1 Tax=Flavobacterium sp. Root901 TaxID=1736605 RepID=UPI00070A4E9D|nr:DUF72 domain-containing protein [Flavobacterium sp. Root901]KRD10362.1 hypothetical protein ASE21_11675 [Flavobacterium sp. Root901]
MKRHSIHIGTSGWAYKHWRGTFYPLDVKLKDQFSYYQKMFNTVEINNTFYGMPADATFQNWESQVSDDFVYIIKANRFITHLKKLQDPEDSLLIFMEKVKFLEKKLGAVLFQLPPSLKLDLELLEDFLLALSTKNRYVFEFRNTSWYTSETYQLLEKYNCAFCIYELAGHISPIQVTADFVYVRLHGPGHSKYQGSYSIEILKEWADQCSEWLKTKDVFVYFDNDEKGYAAFNALELKKLILDKSFETEKTEDYTSENK